MIIYYLQIYDLLFIYNFIIWQFILSQDSLLNRSEPALILTVYIGLTLLTAVIV